MKLKYGILLASTALFLGGTDPAALAQSTLDLGDIGNVTIGGDDALIGGEVGAGAPGGDDAAAIVDAPGVAEVNGAGQVNEAGAGADFAILPNGPEVPGDPSANARVRVGDGNVDLNAITDEGLLDIGLVPGVLLPGQGGPAPGPVTPGPVAPGPGDGRVVDGADRLADALDGLNARDSRAVRRQCRDILANPGGFERSLVMLCAALRR